MISSCRRLNGCKPESLRRKQAWDRVLWVALLEERSVVMTLLCSESVSMQNKFWVVVYLIRKPHVVWSVWKTLRNREQFSQKLSKAFDSRSVNNINCGSWYNLKWNECIFVRFLSHLFLFSTWKYHNWRLPWRVAVYSLDAGYIPVGVCLCPFRCFPRWSVGPPASRVVLYVHTARRHARAHRSISVWFSVSGFCGVKRGYGHAFLRVALVTASTAGSICSAATPDLGWGTLGETAGPVTASAHPTVSFTP